MDIFSLTGSFASMPGYGAASADPQIVAPVDEKMLLGNQISSQLSLSVDGATALPLGSLTSAHVVVLKAVGGSVVARLTSASGSLQVVPFDSFLVLFGSSVPFTAIDVARSPGTATVVRYFLGQKAT